jgi:Mg2+-importing ATPase
MSEVKFQGLKKDRIAELQSEYGLNIIQTSGSENIFLKILSYFKSPIILTLIGASLLSGFLGEVRDAIIIIVMVVLSIGLDFIQEQRADQAAKKLASSLKRNCDVIRDSIRQSIPVRDVVPGDILYLAIGDIVPADAKILQFDSFLCNESILTGESFPTEKKEGDAVFSGTSVIGGWAYCEVLKIGLKTKFGTIAKQLSIKETKNAFSVGIDNFGKLILKLTILIVSSVALIIISKGLLSGMEFKYTQLLEVFLFSITIAVGLTPELLPVVTSLNLAIGSLKMNKNGVLVKKLSAIPDFGSMDILCTDKTGTLTEDKITLLKHIDVNGQESNKVFTLGFYNSYFQSGLKNPLDEAILKHENSDLLDIKKIDEIPYDFNRKRLSVILKDGDKMPFLLTKGQPEEIFKICTKYEVNGGEINKLSAEILANITQTHFDLSKQGFRVLAVCYRSVLQVEKFDINSENDMILCGLLAFLDPPKISAKTTLNQMETYGLKIKILTGDNELVTAKICQEIGISNMGIITGDKLDSLSDFDLSALVEKNDIFARVNPQQKQRIIEILRSNGHVVGYMGDGVNDSLSLKTADVGISVENAVDIAKESADIILLQKDLASLVQGVIEGRKTFGNTQKYMFMALSSNFGNMLSMIGAALFLPFLPMLPTQILFNNLLYDLSQVGIPLDSVDEEYIQKPKKWDLDFIKKFMLIFGPISSLFDLLTFYIMFKVLNLSESTFQTAWFIESLATQILVIYIIRTRKIPFIESTPSKYLVLSTFIMLGVGILTPFSLLAAYFSFTNLSLVVLFTIAVLVLTYLVLVEVLKRWFYRYNQT